jgi:hypothetical protein
MSSQDDKVCIYCGNFYTSSEIKWCKPCQLNNLRQNFKNWTSGNGKIDELIQEMQLNIKYWDNIMVEWIPYSQLNNIKEIIKDDFTVLYSAIWMDGPLEYDTDWKRVPNKEVQLL